MNTKIFWTQVPAPPGWGVSPPHYLHESGGECYRLAQRSVLLSRREIGRDYRLEWQLLKDSDGRLQKPIAKWTCSTAPTRLAQKCLEAHLSTNAKEVASAD